MGILVAGGGSGGHINPAVTVALAVTGKISWYKVCYYGLAQYLGAFFGATMAYFVYYDGLWNFDEGYHTVTGDTATAGIFTPIPEHFCRLGILFLDQMMGSIILMIVICAIRDHRNMEVHRSLYALYIGITVAALSLAYGMNAKFNINPARDFAPRLFVTIAGWGGGAFTYRPIWWIGILGPHVGAIIGAIVYVFFVEIHLPDLEQEQ